MCVFGYCKCRLDPLRSSPCLVNDGLIGQVNTQRERDSIRRGGERAGTRRRGGREVVQRRNSNSKSKTLIPNGLMQLQNAKRESGRGREIKERERE